MNKPQEQWPVCRYCGNTPEKTAENEWQIVEWYEQEAECDGSCDDGDCYCETRYETRSISISIEHNQQGQHLIVRNTDPHDTAFEIECPWCGSTAPLNKPNKLLVVWDELLETLGQLDFDWEEREEMADSKLIPETQLV